MVQVSKVFRPVHCLPGQTIGSNDLDRLIVMSFNDNEETECGHAVVRDLFMNVIHNLRVDTEN